jgi:hypothetical protein
MTMKEWNMRQTLPVASEETVQVDIIFFNIYTPIRGIPKTYYFVIYYNSENADNITIYECMGWIKGPGTLESRKSRLFFCVDILLIFKSLWNTSPKSIGEVKKA